MRSQPRAPQRPEPFPSIDVNFVEAIAIFIGGLLAVRVINGFMGIAPLLEPGLDVVLIGLEQGSLVDGLLNKGLNALLLSLV